MKSPSRSITSLLVIMAGILLLASSCTSRRKLLYLQEKQSAGQTDTVVFEVDTSTYRFQVNDVVYIAIKGLSDETSGPIGSDPSRSSLQNEVALYLNSYSVDDSGYVNLPLIGDIRIEGLSIEDARDTIAGQAGKYLVDPWVNVKLAYFQFTILGEVEAPGVYRVFDYEVNILEALAYAGDLTEYGNRQQIMIVREESSGKRIHHVDISDAATLASEYFYLEPNDIIYIEPYPAKSYGLPGNTLMSSFTTFASVISTLVSLYVLAGVLKSS